MCLCVCVFVRERGGKGERQGGCVCMKEQRTRECLWSDGVSPVQVFILCEPDYTGKRFQSKCLKMKDSLTSEVPPCWIMTCD